MLHVEFLSKGPNRVILSDLAGHRFFNQSTEANSIGIPVGNLSRGMYLITVESSGQKWTSKVLVE